MDKFSNWVDGRSRFDMCEGLASELVKLDIDLQKFSEWFRYTAKNNINEVDLIGGFQGLKSGLGDWWKSGVEKRRVEKARKAKEMGYRAGVEKLNQLVRDLKAVGLKDEVIERAFNFIKNHLKKEVEVLSPPVAQNPTSQPYEPPTQYEPPMAKAINRPQFPISKPFRAPTAQYEPPVAKAINPNKIFMNNNKKWKSRAPSGTEGIPPRQ